MQRRLVLIRHAKAGDGWPDHQRSLDGRGPLDAAALGRWLGAQGLSAERVVVSTALRTRQTWAALASGAGWDLDPEYDDRVYHNTVEDLLEIVRQTPDTTRTVVLVGHNPSTQALALYLDDGTGDPAASRLLRGAFPTSAVAIVAIDGDWSDLGLATGRVVAYSDPHEQ